MDDRDAHARLAELVKSRRLSRRLSVSAAARAAHIDRATWTNLENRTRRLQQYNYAGVERALGWESGSIESVLAGGVPTQTDSPPQRAVTGGDELADEIERIRNLPISARARLSMIEALVAAHEEALSEGRTRQDRAS
jgi:transcriptional regulator with XRE-family HTH domain